MKPAGLLPLGALFGGLSLVSVGGANVLFPSIRRSVVDHQGWLDRDGFSQLFAISQAAPGPNVMLASAIGWQVRGPLGLAVATVAIILPSSLVAWLVGRLVQRSSSRGWVTVVTDALAPLAIGLMLASGLIAAQSAGAGSAGYALSCATAAAIYRSRLNPLAIMAVGTSVFMALLLVA